MPLAWLPLVTMVINTAVGVASVDNDLNNVSGVVRLGWVTHVRTIGAIGFLLDRLMLAVQSLVSWDKATDLR